VPSGGIAPVRSPASRTLSLGGAHGVRAQYVHHLEEVDATGAGRQSIIISLSATTITTLATIRPGTFDRQLLRASSRAVVVQAERDVLVAEVVFQRRFKHAAFTEKTAEKAHNRSPFGATHRGWAIHRVNSLYMLLL
jgi:hypothetical protein